MSQAIGYRGDAFAWSTFDHDPWTVRSWMTLPRPGPDREDGFLVVGFEVAFDGGDGDRCIEVGRYGRELEDAIEGAAGSCSHTHTARAGGTQEFKYREGKAMVAWIALQTRASVAQFDAWPS